MNFFKKLLLLFVVVFSGAANAVTLQDMQQRYSEFQSLKSSGKNPLPFFLESQNSSVSSSASVRYLLENVSFETFATRLNKPSEWCEFIPLHLNIKACGYLHLGSAEMLQFHAGVKGYLPPDKAHQLLLRFESGFENGVYTASLFAEDGPLDSSNIDFKIRAIAIEEQGTESIYLEFDLSSVPGLAASLAKLYLATVARKKIGFSTIGQSISGKPRYVKGQRAATERNIVRYLLAIETYFATLGVDADDQYDQRLERWYDATELYSEQLYELGRSEYMFNKRRERENQVVLQHALENNIEPVYIPLDRRR